MKIIVHCKNTKNKSLFQIFSQKINIYGDYSKIIFIFAKNIMKYGKNTIGRTDRTCRIVLN